MMLQPAQNRLGPRSGKLPPACPNFPARPNGFGLKQIKTKECPKKQGNIFTNTVRQVELYLLHIMRHNVLMSKIVPLIFLKRGLTPLIEV